MDKVQIENNVREIIADKAGISLDEVSLDTDITDVGLDSLDRVDIAATLEVDYSIDIPDSKLINAFKVSDFVELVENSVKR